MILDRIHILLSAVILLLLSFPCHAGNLGGKAGWRYSQFTAEEDGRSVLDATTFTQQYSVMYNTSGVLKRGRLGQYQFGIGYEWTALDSDISGSESDDQSVDLSTGKILYDGSLVLAPGALPFRLKLFSRDLHKTQFDTGSVVARSVDFDKEYTSGIIETGIVDDIINGQRIETGGTLLVGIQNGSYGGRYRDVLSKFPRLLCDYRSIYVKDTKSLTPQNYRERDLAFVSLNKKNNWFHYRFNDYTDYLERDNDTSVRTFMLGTIDHNLVRQWINLTNWIRVSADTSYEFNTRSKSPDDDESNYYVNLYTQGQMSNWRFSLFSNFDRLKTGDSQVKQQMDIPLFFQGEIDRNTAWRSQVFLFRKSGLILAGEDDEVREDDWASLYGQVQIETFRQTRRILTPTLEVEAKRGDSGDVNAARMSMDYRSNYSYGDPLNFSLLLRTLYLDGKEIQGTSNNFWENEATGEVKVRLGKRAHLQAGEKIVWGTGDLVGGNGGRISPVSNRNLAYSTNAVQDVSGSIFRSTSSISLQHTTSFGLGNNISLLYDYQNSDGESSDQLSIMHRLNFSAGVFKVDLLTEVVSGSAIKGETFDVDAPAGEDLVISSVERKLHHSTRVAIGNRKIWELEGEFTYDYQKDRSGDSSYGFMFKERLRYNFYSKGSLARRYAALMQGVDYQQFENFDDSFSSKKAKFNLQANLYPTLRTLLGVQVKYLHYQPEDLSKFSYYLTAAFNAQKFKVSLDYAYGESPKSGTRSERVEHRWEVNVEKFF